MKPPDSLAIEQSRALEETRRLRNRILGVNLRLAREAAGCSIQDCAAHVETPPEDVAAWEIGDGHPSPRQLEMLAGYLNVSIEDLWQAQAPQTKAEPETGQGERPLIRQRIVGGLLRAAREAKGMELEQLSNAVEIDVERLSAYEMGESSIPIDQLTNLADALDRDLAHFETAGMERDPVSQEPAGLPAELEIPDVLRQLASDQRTEGVVKLAAAFSRIPSDELRRIADALLAISDDQSRHNGV